MKKTIQLTLSKTANPFYKSDYFFYTLAFVVMMLGFWTSFFMKLGSTQFGHLVHGVSATLWMLVPIVQAWLITHNRDEWHRRFGKFALLLVPIVVISGFYVVRLMILREPNLAPLSAKFALLDTFSMIFFVTVIVLAIRNIRRGNIERHSQYMACSVLVVLEPAIERVFVYFVLGANDFETALMLAMISVEVIVAIVIFISWRKSSNLPRPYLALLAFLLVTHSLLGFAGASNSFHQIIKGLANF
jgi:hypothetical protein